MPERIAKLKATVKELEAELASLETIDPETRAALEEAALEIQAALRGENALQMETHHFADRLHEAATRFESSHPTLFGVVSRTIDAIGQMGI
jgi:chromosome segregation ATPase